MKCVNISPSTSTVTDNEVMNIMVCVRVSCLKRKNWCIWWGIQLNNGLHRQWTIDEIWWLVVNVLHMDDDALIVGV